MPLAISASWPLSRPRHVQAGVMAATFITLAGLAMTLPVLALGMTALAWALRRHMHWGLYNPGGKVRVDEQPADEPQAGTRPAGEQWRLLDAGGGICLSQAMPVRAWRGPGWLVLRLQGLTPQGGPRRVDATFWRASLGAPAWRQLQERVARLAARASTEGTP